MLAWWQSGNMKEVGPSFLFFLAETVGLAEAERGLRHSTQIRSTQANHKLASIKELA